MRHRQPHPVAHRESQVESLSLESHAVNLIQIIWQIIQKINRAGNRAGNFLSVNLSERFFPCPKITQSIHVVLTSYLVYKHSIAYITYIWS